MRRLRKKYTLSKVRDKKIYDLERIYLAKYGLRSKKELGRGSYYIEKARKLYFLKNQKPVDYEQHLLKNIRVGFLKQGETMLDLTLDSYFSRTLCYIISKREGISIKASRKYITSGKVYYKEKRIKSPKTIIDIENQKDLKFIK